MKAIINVTNTTEDAGNALCESGYFGKGKETKRSSLFQLAAQIDKILPAEPAEDGQLEEIYETLASAKEKILQYRDNGKTKDITASEEYPVLTSGVIPLTDTKASVDVISRLMKILWNADLSGNSDIVDLNDYVGYVVYGDDDIRDACSKRGFSGDISNAFLQAVRQSLGRHHFQDVLNENDFLNKRLRNMIDDAVRETNVI